MDESTEQRILIYLQGKLSPEQRSAFERWLRDDDENRKLVDELQQVWQLTKTETQSVDFDHASEWNKLSKKLPEQAPRRQRQMFFQPWVRVAATVLLVLLSSFGIYQLLIRDDVETISSTTSRLQHTLPDGTSVWLNENSELKYSRNFAKERAVNLRGEAFFDVVRDTSHPFLVVTNDALVRVLGTSFNVRAHLSDTITEVFVASGKVSVASTEAHAESVTLIPGSTAIVPHDHRAIRVVHDDDSNPMAWKNRALVFRKTPMRRVVKALSKYFKKEFVLSNRDLEECRFTGSFKDPQLEEVLESLSYALNVQVDRSGNSYSIVGEGCKGN